MSCSPVVCVVCSPPGELVACAWIIKGPRPNGSLVFALFEWEPDLIATQARHLNSPQYKSLYTTVVPYVYTFIKRLSFWCQIVSQLSRKFVHVFVCIHFTGSHPSIIIRSWTFFKLLKNTKTIGFYEPMTVKSDQWPRCFNAYLPNILWEKKCNLEPVSPH